MDSTEELNVGDGAWWQGEPVIIRAREILGVRDVYLVENMFTEHRAWVHADALSPRNMATITAECARGEHHFTAEETEWVCEHCPEKRPR